jgi:hypothetical protein
VVGAGGAEGGVAEGDRRVAEGSGVGGMGVRVAAWIVSVADGAVAAAATAPVGVGVAGRIQEALLSAVTRAVIAATDPARAVNMPGTLVTMALMLAARVGRGGAATGAGAAGAPPADAGAASGAGAG